ncbi:MAG: hypothetical protein HY788_04410 [Deltaproteobacteria bacterium]|nr:hypothetical protein [Deltaproteobacteria bacterium]
MWVRLARTAIGLCLVFLVFTAMAQAKDRVAVMDFENKSQHGGWRLGSGAADMLATEIVKTGKFQVMERDKLTAVIKEQDLGASGRIDPSTAAQIGKIVGVEYIITGAVTEYGQSELGGEGGGFALKKKGYHATVDIRMVNANTGEIVFADSATHSEAAYNVKVFGYGGGEEFDEKKATEVMRAAIAKLAVKINSAPLAAAGSSGPKIAAGPALVADVDGNCVVLNKGRNGGLQQGQEVTLYRAGKTITDPQTGKVLKVRLRKVGVIKLTTVDDGYAEGEALSGSGFQVGDTTQAE